MMKVIRIAGINLSHPAQEVGRVLIVLDSYDIIVVGAGPAGSCAAWRAALEGLLEPIKKEIFLGRAQVRQVFRVSRVGTVAGCYIMKGTIPRSASIKLLRNKEVVHKGKIRSLKHIKDDIKEAREGFECGISIEGHNDVRAGDLIEGFKIEKITRRLGDKQKTS